MRTIKAGDTVVVDYETIGLRTQEGARAFTYILTWPLDGYSEIVDRDADPVYFLQRLREVWENEKVIKVAQNLKFEIHHTLALGICVKGELHDTMVMHQLLHNLAPKHSLDYIARQYAGVVKEWEQGDADVAKAARIYGTYDKIPRDLVHKYQYHDGERTALVYLTMLPLLMEDKRMYADYRVEISLIVATVQIENNGMMIDREEAQKLCNWMEDELIEIEKATTEICGESVNLSSPKQLAKLLFEKLNLPITGYTPSGAPDTGKDAIEELRLRNDNPILDLILKHRSYTRGLPTVRSYIDNADKNDILYPNINTNRAQTGRQSSSDPINFQNIQKEFSLRTRFAVPARKCFRTRPGTVWYCIDYQGIEMRLGVQGTGSPRLIKLVEENFDFHDACAKTFYGSRYILEQSIVTKKMLRSAAKNARFAMFYGAGLQTVADTLQLSIDDTRAGYERDKREYPEFYEFMARCTQLARKNGYIETFFGRKLHVYHDKPYSATDYKVQGSAAQVLKRAQVALHKYFTEELHGEVKMLLPVHDELIIEYPRSLFPRRKEILGHIRELMINIECITVKLEVEIKLTTTTWDKAKEITL